MFQVRATSRGMIVVIHGSVARATLDQGCMRWLVWNLLHHISDSWKKYLFLLWLKDFQPQWLTRKTRVLAKYSIFQLAHLNSNPIQKSQPYKQQSKSVSELKQKFIFPCFNTLYSWYWYIEVANSNNIITLYNNGENTLQKQTLQPWGVDWFLTWEY